MFPQARIASGGVFLTPQGNNVQTVYVDLSGEVEEKGLCLVKATKPQHDLATASTILLSRPKKFRNAGEVLIQDEQEGRARTSTSESVDVPSKEPELVGKRVSALNAALQLGHTNMPVSGSDKSWRSNTSAAAVTFGKDYLIYCTSMRPSKDKKDEEEAWRRSFPDCYTSFTPIYRPTQFAQGLGLGVCEHIGAHGKAEPTRAVFNGFRTVEERRRSQMVLHGPMLYVDNPYRCIAEAEPGWEKLFAMIFLKSRERDYAAQKEYRFAMLPIGPEVGEVFDLPVSGMLRDCLLPVKAPLGVDNSPVTMGRDEQESGERRETYRGYTYRRSRVRRETGQWGKDGEPGSGRAKEEIVEETVTSPEEIPEPFPEEVKQPDIIVFERVGGQVRFAHEVYREEETTSWRIERLRTNPAIVDDPGPGGLPQALEIPPEARVEALDEQPTDPRFVLDLCLNPSVPRPPWRYEGLARCSRVEVEHALACWRSLGAAVDMFDGEDRERAAASAWYAAKFIVDLVSWFGPIVKSVCVIRECVAVVEFERAPLSGAVGWATFSGTGTYTLYVHRGNVEEVVLPGRFSRAGRMSQSTYMEALQKYGWHLKAPVSGMRPAR